MTGNGWLYKLSLARLPVIARRSMMALLLAGEMAKERNNCESGFHICKLRVQISLGCFVNNGEPIWCQGSKHWIATLRGARFLSASFVSFDVGSQWDYHMCTHAKDSICELFYLFVYFYCDSILLLFWAQSTVHMALAALWMANVSVTVKPIRQDWEVWETEGLEEFVTERKVWRQKQRRYNNLLSAHLLSSIWCCWNAGSSFEMPPRLADQGWKIAAVDKLTGSASHVSLLTPMHEQGAQWEPLSYWCHLSLSFIPLRFSEKASHLKLSHSCLNPHC